jgi:hypothetical protein
MVFFASSFMFDTVQTMSDLTIKLKNKENIMNIVIELILAPGRGILIF